MLKLCCAPGKAIFYDFELLQKNKILNGEHIIDHLSDITSLQNKGSTKSVKTERENMYPNRKITGPSRR